MRGKFLFLAGLAIGFVLGARAGRGAYENLRSKAQTVWNEPTVQKTVSQAEELIGDAASLAENKIADAVRNARKPGGKS